MEIETAGSVGTEIVMQNIDKPEEFRALVFEQIDQFYDDDSPATSEDRAPGRPVMRWPARQTAALPSCGRRVMVWRALISAC